jgi:hypothetical protein
MLILHICIYERKYLFLLQHFYNIDKQYFTMIISRFDASRLRNEEWFRFHTEFLELAVRFGADFLDIEHLFPLYEMIYREGDRLLELMQASLVTADTSEANRNRKRIFCGLRNTAKSLRYVLNPALRDAATKVYAIVRKYNDAVIKGTMGARTAAIDNLLQDLKPGEGAIDCSAEVQMLGLGVWVADLEASNQAYKQAMDERTGEKAARPDAGRLRQVRIDLNHYYIMMVRIVDARLAVVGEGKTGGDASADPPAPAGERGVLPADPDERLLLFVHSLNACIARWSALLKGRRTRSEKRAAAVQAD